jgi:hypothetical protein
MRGRYEDRSCLSRLGAFAGFLVAATLMLVPSQAGAVSFFRGDFPVGSNPTSVAAGNFNGGAPDVAVANEGSDDVSILLGNGLGQFTAAAPVAVGDAPSSVVLGSFNGDAFTDLAAASVGNDNIAIRLGDGSGGFTGTGTVATGGGSDPRSIAAGDFNGDGDTDLISANDGNSTVSVMLGDGMGAFATDPSPEDVSAASSIPAANPVAIAVENTDSHDNPDLDAIIASRTSDQVLVLRGDGAGGFNGRASTYSAMFSATNPDPSAVAVGSLNPIANAEPDILVANQGGTTPDFLLPGFGILGGSGFGYGAGLPTGADPAGVAFADLDGDGDEDGISADSGAGTATAILSNGNGGTDVDTTATVGSSPRAVAAGAFDADTKDDAIVANHGSNSVTVLTSLSPGPPVDGSPQPPAVVPKKKCKKKKGKGRKPKKPKCKKRKKPKK